MRVFAAAFMFLCCAVCAPKIVQAQEMKVSPSTDRIEVTTGFDGADISVFGVAQAGHDIALVMKGPQRRMIVRKKEEVVGAWINRRSIAFESVPGFYHYALSRDDLAEEAQEIFNMKAIGLNRLDFEPGEGGRSVSYYAAFREALIRNKQGEGLFPLKSQQITFLQDGFYKADFHLPSNVPKGRYTIEAYALKNGEVKAMDQNGFDVVQVGFSAKIFRFALQDGLSYGLVSIAIAFFAGWAAFTFLRRD